MHHHDHGDSSEAALRRLREAGYRITNARQTVIEVLCENPDHPTSTEILEAVEKRDSRIGRASVFRTLELLTELAVIRPTYLEPRTPSYIMMPEDGHHAHIICTRCKKVIDLGECEIEDLIAEIAERNGVTLTGHLLELYGTCDSCS